MKEKLLPGCGNIAESDILKQFRQQRVYIETYGCRYNFGDTAKFIEVLKYIGGTLVKSAEEADAVVINTCTVVGATERRMLRRLSRFRDNNLFVMGCMPAVQRDAIFAVCTPTIISSTAINAHFLALDGYIFECTVYIFLYNSSAFSCGVIISQFLIQLISNMLLYHN